MQNIIRIVCLISNNEPDKPHYHPETLSRSSYSIQFSNGTSHKSIIYHLNQSAQLLHISSFCIF
jgi:hypothetical protein